MKLPENFNIKVNIKRALMNAAAAVVFVRMFSDDYILLGASFVFGLFGGSVNDIINFKSNQKPSNNQEGEN